MKDNFYHIIQSSPINPPPKIPSWKKDKWGVGSHWGSPYWSQSYYPPVYDAPLVVQPAVIDADAKGEVPTQNTIVNPPISAKGNGGNLGVYIFGSAIVLVVGYALLSGKSHNPVK